jgi:hypothetical protein
MHKENFNNKELLRQHQMLIHQKAVKFSDERIKTKPIGRFSEDKPSLKDIINPLNGDWWRSTYKKLNCPVIIYLTKQYFSIMLPEQESSLIRVAFL